MSSEHAPAAPEQGNEHGPSYVKKLEHDLRVAQTDTEKIGAVNGLLESVLTDASQNRLRSVRTDRATGQDIETVYTKEQMETNFAKLYDVLFGDEEQRVSYTVAERLLTRTGGLRPAMEHVIGPNADPKLRAAAEVWLKQKHDEVVARHQNSADALDESLLETRPRSEVTELIPAVEAPADSKLQAAAEIGPEELEEIEDELGEVAVEQVVEEPEQVAETNEQAEDSNEERESAVRKLEAQAEEVGQYEHVIIARLEAFTQEGRQLEQRIRSGDHAGAGIATLIGRQIEQIPSLIAFAQRGREEAAQLKREFQAAEHIDEEAKAMLDRTIAQFEESVDELSATLRRTDRALDELSHEVRRGAPVDEQIVAELRRVSSATEQMSQVRLRAGLQGVLESLAR